MFTDEVTIHVKAGKGGDGSVSFFPMKQGPCGGNGGAGGNVVARASNYLRNLNKLSAQRGQFVAEDGSPGESYNKDGKWGKNCVIEVPLNTEITDIVTKRKIVVSDYETEYLLCRGGRGGNGNDKYKSATNRAPKYAEKGFPGEEARFRCVLKLIADVGLIGFPNAGKSSLLNELTRAGVKTAPYPFTTLEPNLGDCDGKIIADIPGLIEGAAEGKGLGHRFLKHIEKVHMLFHCISCETDDYKQAYDTIRSELARYNPTLLEKDEKVLITKLDMVEPKQRTKLLKKIEKELSHEVLGVSIHDAEAISSLKKIILEG
jgi:GTP-binding protein